MLLKSVAVSLKRKIEGYSDKAREEAVSRPHARAGLNFISYSVRFGVSKLSSCSIRFVVTRTRSVPWLQKETCSSVVLSRK